MGLGDTETLASSIVNSPNQTSSKWILNTKQDCHKLEIYA